MSRLCKTSQSTHIHVRENGIQKVWKLVKNQVGRGWLGSQKATLFTSQWEASGHKERASRKKTEREREREPVESHHLKVIYAVLVRVTHGGLAASEALWKLHFHKLHINTHNQRSSLPKPLIGTKFWAAEVQDQLSHYRHIRRLWCCHICFPPLRILFKSQSADWLAGHASVQLKSLLRKKCLHV